MNTSYSRASRSVAVATSVVGLLIGLPVRASAQGDHFPAAPEVSTLFSGFGSLSALANAVFWHQMETAQAANREVNAPEHADLTVAEHVVPVAEVDEGGLVTLTPEPGTLALLAAPIGLLVFGLHRRRQASAI